jgi:hypothetical protein
MCRTEGTEGDFADPNKIVDFDNVLTTQCCAAK